LERSWVFTSGSFSSERILSLSFDAPISYSIITTGEKVEVRGAAKGGTAPYHFDLLILDANGVPVGKGVENKLSENGLIREQVNAPENPAGEAKKHSIVLLLRDSRGLQTRASTDILVRPKSTQTPANQPNPAPKGGGGSSGNTNPNSGSSSGGADQQPDPSAQTPR
jgi:hypothetical protein